MAATNFKSENNTFRKLIGNGLTYRIPRFQRDYSWSNEEWEDLWHDLLGILKSDGASAHYMGYLVLHSADDRSFDVIDGQQRMTTISLIVLAALKNLNRLVDKGNDAEANKRRIEQIRQTYVGYLSRDLGSETQADFEPQQQQLLPKLPGTARSPATTRLSCL
jgi:uncharacterized protein with ParB-like and HNH nuclease domain